MATLLEEQANFSRVARIILDLNSKVQREYLSVIIPAANFPQKFKYSKLNQSQKIIVQNISTIGTYDECDSSLLYILIRNLCNIAPMSGWGKPVQQCDISVADDIERLRVFRNDLYGHATIAKLSNIDFNTFIQEIRAIMVRFDSCHSGTYQAYLSTPNYENELNNIITAPMDPVLQNHYKSHFIRLNIQDTKIAVIEKDLSAQDTKIAEIENDLFTQYSTISKSTDDIADISTDIEAVKKEVKDAKIMQDMKIANVAQEVKTIHEIIADFSSDDHLSKGRHEHDLEYVYRSRWACSICNLEYANTRSYYCLLCNYTKCMSCKEGTKNDLSEWNRMIEESVTDVLKDDGTPHSNFVSDNWCISCHHCQSSDKPFDVLKDFKRGNHIPKGKFHQLYESGFTKRYTEEEFDKELRMKFLSTFRPEYENQPWLLTNLDVDNINDPFYSTCNTLYSHYVNSNYSFLIVGYGLKEHVNNLGINPIRLKKELKIYEQEDGSRRILLYKGEIETLFIMRYTESANKPDISNEVIQVQNDIKLFAALHMETLNQSDITIVGLVMTSGLTDKDLMTIDICGTCVRESLIVSSENITSSLNCIEEKIAERRKNKRHDTKEGFLSLASRVIGFISIKNIHLPNISAHDCETLSRVYLNKQQRKFVHSTMKHGILKGGFGSGKTIMAQIRFHHIIQTADPNDYVYFIFQSNETMLKILIKLKVDNIKNRCLKDDHIFIMNMEEYCQKYGLIAPLMVSDILQDLAERYAETIGKPHLIMDEVDGSCITEKEGAAIKDRLTQFKESYVLLITHSLEIIRKRVTQKHMFLSEALQYEGFRYDATGMKITTLDQTMRNTTSINAISKRTIHMLKKTKNVFYERTTKMPMITSMENLVSPNLDTRNESESSSRRKSENKSLDQLKTKQKKKSPLLLLKTPKENSKKLNLHINKDLSSNQILSATKLETVGSPRQQRPKQDTLFESNNVSSEPSEAQSVVETKSPKNVAISSNIDHILRHVKDYPENRSGMKLVSKFNFPGSWDHGHGVKGDFPLLINIIQDNPLDYSNINKENTKAMFCYVLKRIIKLRLPIDGFGIICFDFIDTQLFYKAIKYLRLPVILYTPSMNADTKLMDIEYLKSNLHSHVIITDHMGSRGLEFKRLLLSINPNEEILHQYLLEAVTRCIYQLIVIAIKKGKKSKSENITCGDIINDWSRAGLVKNEFVGICRKVHHDTEYIGLSCFENGKHHIHPSHNELALTFEDIKEIDIDVGKCLQLYQEFSNTKHIDDNVLRKKHEQNIQQTCSRNGFSSFEDVFRGNNIMVIDLLMKEKYDDMVKFINVDGDTVLHVAIKLGSEESAIRLIENGIPFDIPNNDNLTPIDLAEQMGLVNVSEVLRRRVHTKYIISTNNSHCKFEHLVKMMSLAQDIELIQIIKTFPSTINLYDGWKKPLLHVAAYKNRLDVMKELIKNGADVYAKDIFGSNVLHNVIEFGDDASIDCFLYLSEHYPELSKISNGNKTTLQIAKEKNMTNIIDILEKTNFERFTERLKQEFEGKGLSSYHDIVRDNHIDFLEELMVDEREAMIEFKDENGNSFLHLAVLYDSIQSVRALVKAGMPGDMTDKEGRTPLEIARKSQKYEIAEIVERKIWCFEYEKSDDKFEHVSNLISLAKYDQFVCIINEFPELSNLTDSRETSLLHVSAYRNKLDVMKELIKNGADVYAKDICGSNVLHNVIEFGDDASIDCLLHLCEHYPELSKISKYNKTPLQMANKKNMTNIIDILEKTNSKRFKERLNQVCEQRGLSSYHDIIRDNHIDILDELMVDEREEMMKFKDENENSFLHLAVLFDSIQSVVSFVGAGMPVDVINEEGETPLDMAINSQKYDIAEIIQRKLWCLEYQQAENKFEHVSNLISLEKNNQVIYIIRIFPELSTLTDKHNTSLLHIAAYKNKLHVMQELIINGADVYWKDENGHNVLNHVWCGGNETIDCLVYLNEHYPKLSKISHHCGTPFQMANERNTTNIIDILDKRNSNRFTERLRQVCEERGLSTYHDIIRENHTDILEELLVDEPKEMVGFKDENGNTFLHLAVLFNSIRSVRTLIKADMPVNLTNDEGKTAMNIAINLHKSKIIDVLMEECHLKNKFEF